MCDTVTVVLGDIVLLAFEKIVDLFFFGHRKTAFLQLHKFLFTTAQNFFTTAQSVHNCTLKNPGKNGNGLTKGSAPQFSLLDELGCQPIVAPLLIVINVNVIWCCSGKSTSCRLWSFCWPECNSFTSMYKTIVVHNFFSAKCHYSFPSAPRLCDTWKILQLTEYQIWRFFANLLLRFLLTKFIVQFIFSHSVQEIGIMNVITPFIHCLPIIYRSRQKSLKLISCAAHNKIVDVLLSNNTCVLWVINLILPKTVG